VIDRVACCCAALYRCSYRSVRLCRSCFHRHNSHHVSVRVPVCLCVVPLGARRWILRPPQRACPIRRHAAWLCSLSWR
jgi:hypothetical protein